jgi:hypothetical protein
MLTKLRITIATTLAIAALGAAPALAIADWNVQGSPPNDKTGNAASLSESRAGSDTPAVDARGEFSREPTIPPVVVEIDDPVSGGFDWTAGIIGLAGGVAVAVLAGAAVAGSRRRSIRPSVG